MNETTTSMVAPLFFSDGVRLDPVAASIADLLNISDVNGVRSWLRKWAELLPATGGGVGSNPTGDPNFLGVCGSPTLDRGADLSFLYLKSSKCSEVAGGVFNSVGTGAEEE